MDVIEHLRALVALPGLSAYETPVADFLREDWAPYVDRFDGDRIGSLWGIRHGSGSEPRRRILVATHMDAIGLQVAQVRDGFIRASGIGGIDVRVLPGTLVAVQATWSDSASEPLPGVVASKPPHLTEPGERGKAAELDDLWIDTGLLPDDVAARVNIGDLISFAYPPLELGEGYIASKSLDNRASVAALSYALHLLKGRTVAWDVIAAATVQEEVGLRGAMTSAYGAMPDLAIAIDVGWGRQPGVPNWQTFKLGEGPTIGWGHNLQPKLHGLLADTAKALELPYNKEILPISSGTDASALQIAREGVPTALISIPIRNMHTPVETVAVKDIQRAGRLLAEFIAALDDDTLAKLSLDDDE